MNARDLVSGLKFDRGPGRDIDGLCALHTADTLACLAAGAQTREGAALLTFYRETGHSGTISDVAGAAAVIRFSEWDAIHVPSCATPAAIAIPAALSFAADENTYVKAVAGGYAVGLALAGAVGGVSALPETWPGLFAAPAVAAVSAAIALDLSDEQIAQALVLSLAGSSGRHGRPSGSPSARWFVVGEAAMKGVRAALAARAGIQGDLSLLSPSWMMGQSAAATPLAITHVDPAAIRQVELKPFVSARQGIHAILAFRSLLQSGIDPRTIDDVEVTLPSVAVPVVSRALDVQDRLSTIAHMGLQLGLAAFEPERLMDVDRGKAFSSDTLAFARRVTVVAGDGAAGWPARVTVSAGGRTSQAISPNDNVQGVAQAWLAAKIDSLASCQPHTQQALRQIGVAFSENAGIRIKHIHTLMTELAGLTPTRVEVA